MSADHTPTPWKQGGTCVYALDETGKTNRFYANVQGGYASFNKIRTLDEEVEANAEFIVRAVNAHDDLVAALMAVADYLAPGPACDIEEVVRSALAKAAQS